MWDIRNTVRSGQMLFYKIVIIFMLKSSKSAFQHK
jgi:hypothetical protein